MGFLFFCLVWLWDEARKQAFNDTDLATWQVHKGLQCFLFYLSLCSYKRKLRFLFFPPTYTGTWNSWSARIPSQQCTVGSDFPSFGLDLHLDHNNRREVEIMLEVKIQIWDSFCAAQAHFFTHLFWSVVCNVCCNQSNPTFVLLNWLHSINKNVINFLVHCLLKFSLNK